MTGENRADVELSELAAVYDQHARGVYSLAWRILADRSEAESVVEEVFVEVSRRKSRPATSTSAVASSLLIVTRRRAIQVLRARHRLPAREMSMRDAQSLELRGPTDSQVASVLDVVAGLPPDVRAALELAFFEGLTCEEIGERLGLVPSEVEMRLSVAMGACRAALDRSE
ncbi:MAG: sigma-70 family RNA polymerase sigma factor [Acidobacteriota bacterium]